MSLEHEETELESIDIHYVKAPQYRTIQVDGVYGGPVPNGTVSIAIYNERRPLPRTVSVPVLENGTLNESASSLVDGKEGVVRHVEAQLSVNAKTAVKIAKWLIEKAEHLDPQVLESEGLVLRLEEEKGQS